MSAVAVAAVNRPPPRTGLPAGARPYLALTLAFAGVVGFAASWTHSGHVRWFELAVVLTGGALAQLFAVHMPANQIFHAGMAFTVAAALLLPPELFVLVCVAQHMPEWVRQRHPWYIQSFNIANCTISGLAVWATREAATSVGVKSGIGTLGVAAAVCAGVVYVLVNHALLARMLRLARDHELKGTGLFMRGFTGNISLSVSGYPSGATVSFSPTSVAAPGSSTLTARPRGRPPSARTRARSRERVPRGSRARRR